MANYSKHVVTKPDIHFINSSDEHGPDVLVGTLHGSYRHQNEHMNYCKLLRAKMLAKCPKYKCVCVCVCACLLAFLTDQTLADIGT